ncbi:MAG TPA: amidohydrolase [Pyrinomonadaceae bacterium]|nr:amidohydrolase [Chloracidobacterium sp.]MBL0240667.1 amidohydrolase [Chloracidobacterium sp.]MBP9936393.1 amidohydrolase [Pyrinomonadaceae bacterium]HQY66569.1 amidohydrolase [Pyrinomonadaceae bacterium]HRA41747.1 amidohydrolase [Pyrinomonadaceae bacterium]
MKLLTSAILFFVLVLQGFAQSISADLVITNANIRTMDSKRTVARSVAVVNGKIVAIGSEADTKPLIGAKTRVIDAKGRTVIPGFNDAHVHFLETGQQLSLVELRDAPTPEEFVRRIRDFAAKLPKGRWILGGKWDHENWKPNTLPTAAMIDAATPDNPVFIDRLDGHMALANSLAMKLASVNKDTKEVDGGLIVRDAAGNPAGVFKDAAMSYINRVVPDPSFDERSDAAIAATEHAASLGVTSVTDVSAGTDIGVYQQLMRQGKLKTRIYGCSTLADYKRWERTGVRSAFGDAMLRVGCLKGFADGSLGSTTAWLFEPYLDDPKSTGLPSDEIAKMPELVLAADKAGLQVNIHAIGDKANATVLDIYERTAAADGPRDRRFRIEHSQHLRQADIKRFGSLKVVASMQPFHIIDDGRWAWKRIDEKRLRGAYAFRTLLDTGAVLAFGSDSPVAPLNPLFGVYAAVTRRTLDDKNPNGWIPEQKISVDEAVRAFTWGSAYGEFQENVKGTLEIGKLADMVILSDDIFTIDPVKIKDAKVLMTIVDGRVVFEKK